jgi:hypothetical protein
MLALLGFLATGAFLCMVSGLFFWPPLLLLGYVCLAGMVWIGVVYAFGVATGKFDSGGRSGILPLE